MKKETKALRIALGLESEPQKPAAKIGRPKTSKLTAAHLLKLTESEKAKLMALGGTTWVRAMLAKVK